ncbi:hypothetical protein GF361_04110 [Candidatus Woesearchaeota archaeon]|nr:hypothetical protein [Candidatus Woesearchaeota archaeon]
MAVSDMFVDFVVGIILFLKKNKLSYLYLFLIVNMILGIKLYPIEWAFLGFVFAAAIFYLSKIDSRQFILSAILLLGYCPFLLFAEKQVLAENFAIYSFYFLMMGIVLKFFQKDGLFSIHIDRKFLRKWIIIFVGLSVFSFALAFLFEFLQLLAWSSLYITIVLAVFNYLSLQKQEYHTYPS